MRTQSAKSIFIFVWKAGLILGALLIGYYAIYFPDLEIAPLVFKHAAQLIVISISLYLVARRGERKAGVKGND